jgi:hypothetical protein
MDFHGKFPLIYGDMTKGGGCQVKIGTYIQWSRGQSDVSVLSLVEYFKKFDC